MRKFILLLTIFNICLLPALADHEIEFKPVKKQLLLRQESPVVYKPTRLIIGTKNEIIIKADPGSIVSLATSSSDDSTAIYHGYKLRLGNDLNVKEDIVPENGITKLTIDLPNDKSLAGKKLYFEVIVSKDKDYNDVQIAQIMSPSGRETELNELEICLPSKDVSTPGFMPVLPGMPYEMYKTMESIEQIKADKEPDDSHYAEDINQLPLIQRNLNAPDLKKK